MINSFGTKFRLLNTNRFHLPGTNGKMDHLATIEYGFREFMFFIDNSNFTSYIEEITGGHGPLKIEDDELWNALAKFLEDKKITVFRKAT